MRDHPAIPTEEELELFVATARVVSELPLPDDLKCHLLTSALIGTLLSSDDKDEILLEYQRAVVEEGIVDVEDLPGFGMKTGMKKPSGNGTLH